MNTTYEKPWFVALDSKTNQPQNHGYGFRVYQDSLTIADGVETMAQAYLIAAAPELLEALEELYDADMEYISINNLGGKNNERFIKANNAIAKAKGEK